MPNQRAQRDYKIGTYRGELALIYYDKEGKRHRYALGTSDARQAELIAPSVFADVTRPSNNPTVEELWNAYLYEYEGRAVLAPMANSWKAIRDRFAGVSAVDVSIADCRAHMGERREKGIQDWTLYTELGHLNNVLHWAAKRGFIKEAPYIQRPPQPEANENHLTREQAAALIAACELPHVKLFVRLALATAARHRALLGLTWDRVYFESKQIDLRDPSLTRPHKKRPVVPLNDMALAALEEARLAANSSYVISWRGKRLESIKKSIATAAARANLQDMHPHVLRHTAAVHMAQSRVPLEEIARYLGHSDVRITFRVYARHMPEDLRSAAGVLEY